MTGTLIALGWLLVSLIAAPLVGRAIRLGHDRDACPTCRAIRAARAPIPGRCLVCDGTPLVADVHTHSALVHNIRRPLGVEDRADWSTR